jgi:hypothetical protein
LCSLTSHNSTEKERISIALIDRGTCYTLILVSPKKPDFSLLR